MTRVSTSMAYQQALRDLQRNQAEVARLQAGVGSGLRIQKPSDDPAGASRALDISGRTAEAREALRQAVAKDPASPEIRRLAEEHGR